MGFFFFKGLSDTNVNNFHEIFFGLHGVFMEHLDCALIGHGIVTWI